jgi:hypothetical protein
MPIPKGYGPHDSAPARVGRDYKEQSAMRTAKTHFEQIPVEIVKKIAEEAFPEVTEMRNNHVILKPPAKKTEPHARGEHSRCRNGI